MTLPINYHQDGLSLARLDNFKLNNKAADPVSPVVGVPWINTTEQRIKYFNGTEVKSVALLEDLSAIGRYRGSWDADTGIPTAANSTILPGDPIVAGDWWRIVGAGTIPNLLGEDSLEAGDLLFADADDANTASQFFGVQANVNLSPTRVDSETVVLESLPANSPTEVASNLDSITSYKILSSANKDLSHSFEVEMFRIRPKIVITSLTAYSDLSVIFMGLVENSAEPGVPQNIIVS
jgi:hypothetical protein